MNLASWLKTNGFRADQVQTFYPSPMAMATAMYHSERDPIHRVGYKSAKVHSAKGLRQRRLHKAFLRYHDPDNWPLIREALQRMGKAHLIGYGKKHLVPPTQPANHPSAQTDDSKASAKTRNQGKKFLTQHTGLPPRSGKSGNSHKSTNSHKSANSDKASPARKKSAKSQATKSKGRTKSPLAKTQASPKRGKRPTQKRR